MIDFSVYETSKSIEQIAIAAQNQSEFELNLNDNDIVNKFKI